MDSSDVLTNLIELTNNVTDAFTTALYVADPLNRTLRLKEHVTLSAHLDSEITIPFGEGPIGIAASDKKPLLQEFEEGDIPTMSMYSSREDLKGMIAIPVVHENLEGVLVVDSKEKAHFSTRIRNIAAKLADQMAWHLNQEKRARGWDDDSFLPYKEIVKVCRLFGESPDRQALTDQFMQIPRSLIDYDAIAVTWFNKEGSEGRVNRHQGWDHGLRGASILPGRGITGSCAKYKIPLLISDTRKRSVVVFTESEKQESARSLLAVPVILNGKALAVITCGGGEPETFSKTDLDKLTLLASFASSAIMYQEVREQWDYDKNLCQVTHIPNHRFLTTYRKTIEKDVFQKGRPVFALAALLNNLPFIYESQGIDIGDQALKQAVSVFAKSIHTPKYMFRYSDNALLIVLMDIKREEALALQQRLQQTFEKKPVVIDNRSIELKLECGLSFYPADSQDLGELAGISLARAARGS